MIKTPATPHTTPDGRGAASAPDTLATPVKPAADLCDVRHTSAEVVAPIRRTLVSLRAAEALAATFSVLGDPTRVRLLDALAAAGDVRLRARRARRFERSRRCRIQLRLLRSLRLVRSRRSGRLVFYRLDDEHPPAAGSGAASHRGRDGRAGGGCARARCRVRGPGAARPRARRGRVVMRQASSTASGASTGCRRRGLHLRASSSAESTIPHRGPLLSRGGRHARKAPRARCARRAPRDRRCRPADARRTTPR